MVSWLLSPLSAQNTLCLFGGQCLGHNSHPLAISFPSQHSSVDSLALDDGPTILYVTRACPSQSQGSSGLFLLHLYSRSVPKLSVVPLVPLLSFLPVALVLIISYLGWTFNFFLFLLKFALNSGARFIYPKALIINLQHYKLSLTPQLQPENPPTI